MSVENASEVTAKYSINYTIDNTKNIPLEFSLTGTDGWTNDITTLSATDVIKTNSNILTKARRFLWIYYKRKGEYVLWIMKKKN